MSGELKGDTVLLVDIGKEAVVLELPDASGNVQVQAGIIRTRTKLKNLRLKEQDATFTDKDNQKKMVSTYRKTVSTDCKSEIDLRGMDSIEALGVLDRYLDEAMRSNVSSVRIIHGKGTGTLRTAVQQALRKNKFIKKFRLGVYGEGEDGVTIVEFR